MGQDLLKYIEIAKKLKDIIDGVIATGDWGQSFFLKNSVGKLQELSNKAAQLFSSEKQNTDANDNAIVEKRTILPGYSQVFILLYQVNGADLDGWYRTVKTLIEYSVTRPVYKNEEHVKEFIRAKASGVEHNGYAVVNIKDSDFYSNEQVSIDSLGHQLFALKENAVKLENIVEFVHANTKRYVISNDKLVLLGKF